MYDGFGEESTAGKRRERGEGRREREEERMREGVRGERDIETFGQRCTETHMKARQRTKLVQARPSSQGKGLLLSCRLPSLPIPASPSLPVEEAGRPSWRERLSPQV